MTGEDILGNLEAMMNEDELHVPHAQETGRADGDGGMHSALAAISDPGIRERVLRIALDHQVDKRDPAWLMVETAVVSVAAAVEAGAAARLVHEDVTRIPAIIQKAVVSGGEDVAGQVRAALTSNLEEFAKAIGQGVHLATDNAVTNVQTALQDFDGKVDKAIIARKDAVLAQWVQSGSDALNKRVREAMRTERTVNLAFMMFAILSALGLGIVLGMHLHF